MFDFKSKQNPKPYPNLIHYSKPWIVEQHLPAIFACFVVVLTLLPLHCLRHYLQIALTCSLFQLVSLCYRSGFLSRASSCFQEGQHISSPEVGCRALVDGLLVACPHHLCVAPSAVQSSGIPAAWLMVTVSYRLRLSMNSPDFRPQISL